MQQSNSTTLPNELKYEIIYGNIDKQLNLPKGSSQAARYKAICDEIRETVNFVTEITDANPLIKASMLHLVRLYEEKENIAISMN